MLALLAVLLASGLAMVPVIVLGGIGIAASDSAAGAAIFLGIVGLSAALALLGLWFWTTFAIFPTVLLEGRTAAQAVRRSLKLGKGARLRILGIMLVVLIIRDGPSLGIFALFGGFEMFTSPATAGTVGAGVMAIQDTLDLLFGSLITPFAVATLFLLYHDRRVRLEAADLETAAAAMATDGQ